MPRTMPDEAAIAEAIAAYPSTTIKALAKRLGVSAPWLSRQFRARGVRLRTPAEVAAMRGQQGPRPMGD